MNADAIYLQSKMKSTGKAYIFFIFLGMHYLYLGKIGTQILFWITGGGLLIWAVIDLFRMSSIVDSHNKEILKELRVIEENEKKERLKEMIAFSNMRNNN